MKKVFGLILILALGLFAVSGCQQATETTPTEVPDGDSVAGSVGGLMSLSTDIDNTAMGYMGISSVSSAGLKALTAGNLTYNETGENAGWWTFSTSEGIVAYNFKAKAYTATPRQEITEISGLGNANELVIVATLTMGSTLSYKFGTDNDPLVFEGIGGVGTKGLGGTVQLTVTDDQSNSYSLTLVYSGITLDSYGLPASGTATFTFASNDYVAIDATIVYNGDQTATLTFTAPTELAAESYDINLLDGTVTPASL